MVAPALRSNPDDLQISATRGSGWCGGPAVWFETSFSIASICQSVHLLYGAEGGTLSTECVHNPVSATRSTSRIASFAKIASVSEWDV